MAAHLLPVLVQVVDTRDEAAVLVGVVHVPEVVGAGPGVAGHHSLQREHTNRMASELSLDHPQGGP